MALPEWLLRFAGVASALAAWTGAILSLRREFADRTKLTFSFEATLSPFCDEEGAVVGESPSIQVTINNRGSKPIAIDKITCVYRSRNRTEMDDATVRLGPSKAARGEPVRKNILFLCEPALIDRIFAIDTDGAVWKANWREMRRARSKCNAEWPVSN